MNEKDQIRDVFLLQFLRYFLQLSKDDQYFLLTIINDISQEKLEQIYRSSFTPSFYQQFAKFLKQKAEFNSYIFAYAFLTVTTNTVHRPAQRPSFVLYSTDPEENQRIFSLINQLKKLDINLEGKFTMPPGESVEFGIFLSIILKYFKYVNENHGDWTFSIGLLLNDFYVVQRDAGCFFDPRGVNNLEKMLRFLDMCRISPLWYAAFLVVDTSQVPFIKDLLLKDLLVIISLLETTGVINLKALKAKTLTHTEITKRIKGGIAHNSIVQLEERYLLAVLQQHPCLLAFCDPQFREQNNNPKTGSYMEQIKKLNAYHLKRKILKILKYWQDRQRDSESTSKPNKDTSNINKLSFEDFWRWKLQIVTILKFIELIPILGEKKLLLEKFLLKQLEKIQNILIDIQFFNCYPFKNKYSSKIWRMCKKVDQLTTEILYLILMIKQLLLVLRGENVPYYNIYGELQTCLALLMKWMVELVNLISELKDSGYGSRKLKPEKLPDFKLRKTDDTHEKLMKILSLKMAKILDFGIRNILAPYLVYKLMSGMSEVELDAMKRAGEFARKSAYIEPLQPQIEVIINQGPRKDILIFEPSLVNDNLISDELELFELKKEESAVKLSQDELIRQVLDSPETSNLIRRVKKRQFFIVIPSLRKN